MIARLWGEVLEFVQKTGGTCFVIATKDSAERTVLEGKAQSGEVQYAKVAKVKIETKERKPLQRHRPIGQTVAGVREVVDGRQVLRRGPRGGYACGRCGKWRRGAAACR